MNLPLQIAPPEIVTPCNTSLDDTQCLDNRNLFTNGTCNELGDQSNFVYVIEGCQMVAISLHADPYWFYDPLPLLVFMYVNLKNGNDVPLGKNATDHPDYSVGELVYNELRISVSLQNIMRLTR
jgi:hypothetical protein